MHLSSHAAYSKTPLAALVDVSAFRVWDLWRESGVAAAAAAEEEEEEEEEEEDVGATTRALVSVPRTVSFV